MRHFGFIALLAPFALLAFGCEEDPSSSPGGFQLPEGGSGFEIPDSSTPTPDSSTPDAPAPSGVTVTVVRQGAPQTDVRVIFHDATGAVTGDFTQPVAPSMVTVLAPYFGDELSPLTYLAVAEGDTLTVELGRAAGTESPPIGEYSVTFGQGFDTAQDYRVQAGPNCNSFGPADGTFVVTVYPECVGAQGVVLASASGRDEMPLAFSFAKNLAKPMGGATITVPALPAFVAAGSLTVSAANMPLGEHAWPSTVAIVDGRAFELGFGANDLAESPATFRVPVGFADAHQVDVGTYSNDSSRAIIKREPATVGNITLDFATLLPTLGDTNIVADDLKRPKVTWSPSASLNGTDGGIVSLRWYGSSGFQWRFVVPPGTTEVTAPALPGDLSIPPSTEADVALDDLAFVEATFLADYKGFKSLPMPTNANLSLLSTDAPLPVNGTVRTVRTVIRPD